MIIQKVPILQGAELARTCEVLEQTLRGSFERRAVRSAELEQEAWDEEEIEEYREMEHNENTAHLLIARNVGAVLRTLDAFDGDGLFLLPGCADPYSPKTLRSSMGALFRRPVWSCSASELCRLLQRSGLPLYGAALRLDTLDARTVDLTRAAVAIGSEGRGLSQELLALCDGTVRIPMSPRCESLNAAVAASVLLWEGYRVSDGRE